MKIQLQINPDEEESIIITAKNYTEEIQKIYEYLQKNEQKRQTVIGYDGDAEYYLDLHKIVFFETEEESVYAHSTTQVYSIKQRLYELEKTLPHKFMRISKSTILNLSYLHAIEYGIGGPKMIRLQQSNKVVYVSRKYYPLLKEKLKERL